MLLNEWDITLQSWHSLRVTAVLDQNCSLSYD